MMSSAKGLAARVIEFHRSCVAVVVPGCLLLVGSGCESVVKEGYPCDEETDVYECDGSKALECVPSYHEEYGPGHSWERAYDCGEETCTVVDGGELFRCGEPELTVCVQPIAFTVLFTVEVSNGSTPLTFDLTAPDCTPCLPYTSSTSIRSASRSTQVEYTPDAAVMGLLLDTTGEAGHPARVDVVASCEDTRTEWLERARR